MSKSLYNLSQSRSNIYNDQYSIKIAGAPPRATSFYIANSSGTSYSRANNENKHLVMCVNQLSGTGRYRSQFRPNADGNRGKGCEK
uniref:Uncharacterized protein n=1 Tax=Nucleocytoviricota sp. TaxID=2809609 RepID=A0A9E8G529_9VIRU|nr:hypothetical protein [Nucleocytoviricota sp.]UZT29246.1 hypothetical protein [Nucleocytoviricota sp.]